MILAALSEREMSAQMCAGSAEVGVAADGLRTCTRTCTNGLQVLLALRVLPCCGGHPAAGGPALLLPFPCWGCSLELIAWTDCRDSSSLL